MPSPLLVAENLGKSFGAVMAAVDVNVSVNAGEIVGVIGANGAGKTTFCNMVTGYIPPDEGRILFQDKVVTGWTVGEATLAGIHRSFQIPQLFEGLTVRDNLLLSLGVFGRNPPPWFRPLRQPSIEEEAERILDRYQIAPEAEAFSNELPQGVRKLLDIAMAMVGNPSMILLDEPTSGISSEEKLGVMDTVVGALREAETTVLFVEHDMEVVGRYAERVIAFWEGRIIADGPPAEVLRDPRVVEHVVGGRRNGGEGDA